MAVIDLELQAALNMAAEEGWGKEMWEKLMPPADWYDADIMFDGRFTEFGQTCHECGTIFTWFDYVIPIRGNVTTVVGGELHNQTWFCQLCTAHILNQPSGEPVNVLNRGVIGV